MFLLVGVLDYQLLIHFSRSAVYNLRSCADHAWGFLQVQCCRYRGQYQWEIRQQGQAFSSHFCVFMADIFSRRSFKRSAYALDSTICSSPLMGWLGMAQGWLISTVGFVGFWYFFFFHTNACLVTFRLIVFRPFKGEIILGKITGNTEDGVKSTSPAENPLLSRPL